MAVIYQEPYPASTRGNRWGIKGPFYGPAGHRGQDWAPGNADALALADGVVVISQWSSVLGHVVELRHADGMHSGYAHLATAGAKIGTKVARHHSVGAKLGDTGSAASGRHAHITVSKQKGGIFSGPTIDPLKWIADHDEGDKATFHVVKSGDTLSEIAAHYKVPLATIEKLNPKVDPDHIAPGQKVRVS